MVVYALIELKIKNMGGMNPYLAALSDTIAGQGGIYLVRAGGLGEHPVKVILEFPSIEAAKNWYNSAEYQAIRPHRAANSQANFIWAEGV